VTARLSSTIIEDVAYVTRRMRPDEIAQFLALTNLTEYDPDVAARALLAIRGPSFTAMGDDGLPFCVAGFEPVSPGVWQPWMAGTMEGWDKHWRFITKTTRRWMDQLFDNGARRIQTFALASRKDAHEWYARGMQQQFEGLHRQWFADGQDAVCYARVRGDRDGR
jgi:hypothetical protein